MKIINNIKRRFINKNESKDGDPSNEISDLSTMRKCFCSRTTSHQDKSCAVLIGVLYLTDTGLTAKESSTMTCTPQAVDVLRKANVLIVPGCWKWMGIKVEGGACLATLLPSNESFKPGIPNVRWFGVEGENNVLVMNLLGPSPKDLFKG
ncbi:hypothetical protein C5167_037192 [Papaver somniferum]|uniref:Uncharacterized protein n=1 Tax=Papaver somniferum TaxID=3469 RepID=A0A4Y7IA14_PAPSO|nr:hypothetical protein C5167_037192 [Papaver somniferum]